MPTPRQLPASPVPVSAVVSAVLVVSLPVAVMAQSIGSGSSSSSSSSACCDDSDSSCCSTTAPSLIALTFVILFFAALLAWCGLRVCQHALLTGPSTRLASALSLLSKLKPASSPQIHTHLHPYDSPHVSPPAHPSSLHPFPFIGQYRIGSNSHLSPFTLTLSFHHDRYPRTITGSGTDDSQSFSVVDGLLTLSEDGQEQRCSFVELFTDGSRYVFHGHCRDGLTHCWTGRWWKEGGDQTGVFAFEPDVAKWETWKRDGRLGSSAAADDEQQQGATAGGSSAAADWDRRRAAAVAAAASREVQQVDSPLVDTEEASLHADWQRADSPMAMDSEVVIEMSLSRPQPAVHSG